MVKVNLFRCFKEDRRISMDLYADELYKQLSANFSHKFTFKQFTPKISGVIRFLPNFSQIKMRIARVIGYPIQSFRQFKDINHIIDHGYSNLLFYIWGKKTVVTVHDLIPLLAWRGKVKGLYYPHYPLLNHLSYIALKYADEIIADSENTKKDLINELGLKKDSITVIHCGIGEKFKPISMQRRNEIRIQFGFRESNAHYVLISGNQSYKNHSSAIRAVAKIQFKTRFPIQIVRLASTFDKELHKTLAEVKLEMPIISISDLDEDNLVKLYQSVDCLLFPSWYEGFGLPPLEAMACGVPVIASNVASIPEVIGNAGILAEPDDIEQLSIGLYELLENQSIREAYILKGINRAEKFTWRKTAEQTANVYQKMLETKI